MIPTTVLFFALSTVALANYSPPIPPFQAQSVISCYSSPPTTSSSRSTISDPAACLKTCGSSPAISAFIQKTAEGYDCLCAGEADIAKLPGGVCDENGWYVYTPYPSEDVGAGAKVEEPAAAAAAAAPAAVQLLAPYPVDEPAPAATVAVSNSGYKRRSRVMGLCDAGMRPCNVAGEESAYECVDVKTAVKSCGACSTGEYLMGRGKKTSAKGVDCTVLPGVHQADVSCEAGKCIVKSCIDGFKLVGGKCTRA